MEKYLFYTDFSIWNSDAAFASSLLLCCSFVRQVYSSWFSILIMAYKGLNNAIAKWIIKHDATMLEMPEDKAEEKNRRYCSNPNCGKAFDKPKILHVCPHCLTEIQEDQKSGCQYWFGYLGQKENGERIPNECIECEKSIECMLKKEAYSTKAVKEIKKWWQWPRNASLRYGDLSEIKSLGSRKRFYKSSRYILQIEFN